MDVDLSKLGVNIVAYIMLKISPKGYEETLRNIINVSGISEAYEISGEYQVLLKVRVADNRELAKVVDELGGIGNVLEVKVLYVIRELMSTYELIGRSLL